MFIICLERVQRETLCKPQSPGLDRDHYDLPATVFTDILKSDSDSLPDFAYHDLYNYVVFSPSPYTGREMKAYKSLDAYNFLAGWVTGLQQWKVNAGDLHLIQAKVSCMIVSPGSFHFLTKK